MTFMYFYFTYIPEHAPKEEGSWLGIGVKEHRQGPLGDDNYDVSLCISLFGDRVALEGH